MRREVALAILKAHAAELKALGVVSLSLFGSTARDEASEESDIDIAVTLLPGPEKGLAYLGRLDTLKGRLSQMLGHPVDLIVEPTSRSPIQQEIERDRHPAF
jgi:predicted nucleotidyltransferase